MAIRYLGILKGEGFIKICGTFAGYSRNESDAKISRCLLARNNKHRNYLLVIEGRAGLSIAQVDSCSSHQNLAGGSIA